MSHSFMQEFINQLQMCGQYTPRSNLFFYYNNFAGVSLRKHFKENINKNFLNDFFAEIKHAKQTKSTATFHTTILT